MVGNTTLLIGTEDDRVGRIKEILSKSALPASQINPTSHSFWQRDRQLFACGRGHGGRRNAFCAQRGELRKASEFALYDPAMPPYRPQTRLRFISRRCPDSYISYILIHIIHTEKGGAACAIHTAPPIFSFARRTIFICFPALTRHRLFFFFFFKIGGNDCADRAGKYHGAACDIRQYTAFSAVPECFRLRTPPARCPIRPYPPASRSHSR